MSAAGRRRSVRRPSAAAPRRRVPGGTTSLRRTAPGDWPVPARWPPPPAVRRRAAAGRQPGLRPTPGARPLPAPRRPPTAPAASRAGWQARSPAPPARRAPWRAHDLAQPLPEGRDDHVLRRRVVGHRLVATHEHVEARGGRRRRVVRGDPRHQRLEPRVEPPAPEQREQPVLLGVRRLSSAKKSGSMNSLWPLKTIRTSGSYSTSSRATKRSRCMA